jgi:hypothetical protein
MRALVKLALTGLVIAVAACGGGDGAGTTGPTPVSVAGTYQLETFDGEAPPVAIVDVPDLKVEILSGNFILATNLTFTTSATFRITESGQVSTETETSPGTYAVTGSTVTFTYTGGGTDTGTISGNTLTLTGEGFTAVFRK